MSEDTSLTSANNRSDHRQSSGSTAPPFMPPTSLEGSSRSTINPAATMNSAKTLGKRPRETSAPSFQRGESFDGPSISNRQGSPNAADGIQPNPSSQRPRLTARLSDNIKEGSSTPPGQSSTSSAAGGNVAGSGQASAKPQKACVNCRRSKVKCINLNAEPPCQKCKETGQLCKFQLRSDDYEWRDRTEAMIGRLSDAVEGLVSAQQQHFQQMQVQHQDITKSARMPVGSSPRNTMYQSPVLGAPTSLPPPSTQAALATSIYAGGTGPAVMGFSHPRSPSNSTGSAMAPSPGAHSNHSAGGGGGGPGMNGSSSAMLPPLLSSGPALRNALPAPVAPGHHRHGRSPSFTSGRPHHMPGSSSAPSGLAAAARVPSIPTSQPVPHQSPHRNSVDTFAKHWLRPQVSPELSSSSAQQHPLASKACQIDPSYTLSQVLKSETPEKVASLTPTRWIVGGSEWENYARPVEVVGRDDPRLNAIGMGLIPADRARWLFIQ